MSQLVTSLKREHQILVETLEKVKSLGVTTPEAQKMLHAAKSALVAHLKKEDAELYPALRRAAEKNPSVKPLVDRFQSEMTSITPKVLAFFDKYQKGGTGLEFGRDVGRLLSDLGNRIRKEELDLYPAYDQHVR